MMASSIPIVGLCFADAEMFLDYLDDVAFTLWRPRFITVHHTGAPDLKTWEGWQTRSVPVTDKQWMNNLARYYGVDMGWSAGPHFFVTPKHICVLSPPNKRGVHAVSFNAVSWGVECVGDFDREPFAGPVRSNLIDALAVMHIAAGLQPAPYERGVRGLHFHRDDPKTTKTCPGKNVDKTVLIDAVAAKITDMTDGDHPEEHVDPETPAKGNAGIVNTDDLKVRADASARAPILATLRKGDHVSVTGEARNGETLWLAVTVGAVPGWVAARYVDVNGAR